MWRRSFIVFLLMAVTSSAHAGNDDECEYFVPAKGNGFGLATSETEMEATNAFAGARRSPIKIFHISSHNETLREYGLDEAIRVMRKTMHPDTKIIFGEVCRMTDFAPEIASALKRPVIATVADLHYEVEPLRYGVGSLELKQGKTFMLWQPAKKAIVIVHPNMDIEPANFSDFLKAHFPGVRYTTKGMEKATTRSTSVSTSPPILIIQETPRANSGEIVLSKGGAVRHVARGLDVPAGAGNGGGKSSSRSPLRQSANSISTRGALRQSAKDVAKWGSLGLAMMGARLLLTDEPDPDPDAFGGVAWPQPTYRKAVGAHFAQQEESIRRMKEYDHVIGREYEFMLKHPMP